MLTQCSAGVKAPALPKVRSGLWLPGRDTVYAFDQSYRQVWKRSLGSPSPAEERQCCWLCRVRAVRVNSTGHLHVLWHTSGSITGSPVIGGGRVWALDTTAGVLHALDPSDGQSLGQADVGVANRFATPALYGQDVIVPTLAGIAVVRTS